MLQNFIKISLYGTLVDKFYQSVNFGVWEVVTIISAYVKQNCVYPSVCVPVKASFNKTITILMRCISKQKITRKLSFSVNGIPTLIII